MKRYQKVLLAIIPLCFILSFMYTQKDADPLQGSWIATSNDEQQVLLFQDGYCTFTRFTIHNKKFIESLGGPYKITGNKLALVVEFNTANNQVVGETLQKSFSISNTSLSTDVSGENLKFLKQDDGKENLAGLWKISGRKQGDSLVQIHQRGTRKTIKILTGTRFQWAAINPGTKEFSGSGGGRYTFENGKYTEFIEFFSRDSSRVGASLTFDGRLENGEWHHSGLSSKGDPIYEIWSRKQ